MMKSDKIGLIRFEFATYFDLIGQASTLRVSEIVLTEDDLSNMVSQCNEINWIPVENVDIIDCEEIDNGSVVEIKKRICGIFDAEPRDWKYARIVMSNSTKDKEIDTITKMPMSPIVPVFFNVKIDE